MLVRECIIREKKIFCEITSKMVTPPSPFYEVHIYFLSDHFLSEKKVDFEGCLKGVDGCFKDVWRVLQGVWSVCASDKVQQTVVNLLAEQKISTAN